MDSLTTREYVFPLVGKNDDGKFQTFVRFKDSNGVWWLQKIVYIPISENVADWECVVGVNLIAFRAMFQGFYANPNENLINLETRQQIFYKDEFQHSNEVLLYAADDNIMFDKSVTPLLTDRKIHPSELDMHNYWIKHYNQPK